MRRDTKVLVAKVAVIGAVPLIVYAFREGPPVRKTGAPGDSTCLSCHIGPRFDNSSNLNVTFPGGLTYTPGVRQRLTLTIGVSGVEAWGFEMTARLSSDQINGQAGTFSPADGKTQVKCDGDIERPAGGCPASGPVEFIEHTLQGSGSNTFTFDWTPPATNAGNVEIYVAANASTGPPPAGANIHLKHYTLTPAVVSNPDAPVISQNGVVNGASFQPGLAPGSWGTIAGTNLSATTQIWQASNFINGTGLPTSLGGVSVLIDGHPAYVEFISPTQINFVAPADTHSGPVTIQVVNNGVVSNTATGQLGALAPAFFLFAGRYAAATHVNFKPAGNSTVSSRATPAKPGETIILWATGFGPTNPPDTIGQLSNTGPGVATLPAVMVGGVPARVLGAARSPGFAGLYQIAIQVPAVLGDGDQPIVAEVQGVQSPAGVLLTVQH